MFVIGSIAGQAASGVGFIATSIAVGGFLAHAKPALARDPEPELRRATVEGGLYGLLFAVILIVVSGLKA
jgi:F0F1-type ATP synthase membrane subunit c/vacuolar-type H+-ATPase subunit K